MGAVIGLAAVAFVVGVAVLTGWRPSDGLWEKIPDYRKDDDED